MTGFFGYNRAMNIHAIKTPLVLPGVTVESVIKETIPHLEEKSVLVIASKIFSYAENRLVKRKSPDKSEKWELAKKEADWWLDPNESKYQCMLTIKGNWMFANAGIDESNAEDNAYVLWPKNPQDSVNRIWEYLRLTYEVNEVGVIMSDSRALPLSWGVMGHSIAACGFEALKSYIGSPDLFGRPMQMEQINIAQSLVSAGTLVMGEGAERTPIAVITDIPQIHFQDHIPTQAELERVKVSMKDDIFAPLLTNVPWQKGGSGKE